MHLLNLSVALSCALACCIATGTSAQPVTTIITHGFDLDIGNPVKDEWMEAMASAIVARADGGVVLRYLPMSGDWTFAAGYSGPINLNKPIILLFNWVDESDGGVSRGGLPATNWGYAQAAGDALYAALRDPSGALSGIELLGARMVHFIGHSRGTVVNDYVVRRLGVDDIPVDQATTLDPHPVDGTLDGCILGFPNWGDEIPTRWTNVDFADNYWRTDSDVCDFDGMFLPDAWDGHLEESALDQCVLIPPCEPYSFCELLPLIAMGYAVEHSDTHLWYHGTIDTATDVDDGSVCISPAMRDVWYSEYGGCDLSGCPLGYHFSTVGGGERPTLGTAGLTPIAVPIVYNGGFDNSSYAGWAFHGGADGGTFSSLSGNPYLRLTPSSPEIKHNRFYMPECGTKTVTIRAKRDSSPADANDALEVVVGFGDDSAFASVIGPVSLASLGTASFTTLSGTISSGLVDFDGKSCVLIVRLIDTSSGIINTTAGIDDVVVSTGDWFGEIGQPGVGGGGTPCNFVLFLTSFSIHNGELIAGGNYHVIGGQTVNFVSRWNGSAWQSLGAGMNCQVEALVPHSDDLIAGGYFTTAGGQSANRIARWTGSFWQPLASGMNAPVHALAIYNGDLIAGGQFTTAGGAAANGIARWIGASWQPLSSGVSASPPLTGMGVRALTVYNGDLIAGGVFTIAGSTSANYIARWNGASWQALGIGMNSSVHALAVHNGELIAGGLFTIAGGQGANRVARWDGALWEPMGPGMNLDVYALAVHQGELFAGGSFTSAGGQLANKVARWNGFSWAPLGSGLEGTSDIYVRALAVYNDDLAVGGKFTIAGGVSVNSVALWQDTCADGCVGDLDDTGAVNGVDLAMLLGQWTGAAMYSPCPPPASADLNGDCKINGFDLALLLGAWGLCT